VVVVVVVKCRVGIPCDGDMECMPGDCYQRGFKAHVERRRRTWYVRVCWPPGPVREPVGDAVDMAGGRGPGICRRLAAALFRGFGLAVVGSGQESLFGSERGLWSPPREQYEVPARTVFMYCNKCSVKTAPPLQHVLYDSSRRPIVSLWSCCADVGDGHAMASVT